MSRFFSTKYNEGALDFSLFILRLTGGGLMVKHGFDKLIHFTDTVKKFPDPIHIGSTLSLALVIFAEFFCAVLSNKFSETNERKLTSVDPRWVASGH